VQGKIEHAIGHHWQGRHACRSHEWKILSPAAACLSLLTSAGTKEQKSTPTACPRFFAFLPPHSTPPSMIHGSIRNKLNQPTTNSEDPAEWLLGTSGSRNLSRQIKFS